MPVEVANTISSVGTFLGGLGLLLLSFGDYILFYC